MTLSPAFHRAEAAYLTPDSGRDFDAPDAPVSSECSASMTEAELAALDEAPCDPGLCVHCDQPVCDKHASDSDYQETDGCEGKAHVACHAQLCTDPRDCFYDG